MLDVCPEAPGSNGPDRRSATGQGTPGGPIRSSAHRRRWRLPLRSPGVVSPAPPAKDGAGRPRMRTPARQTSDQESQALAGGGPLNGEWLSGHKTGCAPELSFPHSDLCPQGSTASSTALLLAGRRCRPASILIIAGPLGLAFFICIRLGRRNWRFERLLASPHLLTSADVLLYSRRQVGHG